MRLEVRQRYRRWRHGRGFGIHSPFAFDFITATLRCRLPYYAYDRLDALCRSLPGLTVDCRRVRLLFRILVHFNPSTVSIAGDINSTIERAAVGFFSRSAKVVDTGADMIIVNDDCDKSRWPDMTGLKRRAVAFFPDLAAGGSATRAEMWKTITHGMRFDNGKGVSIIVADPRLPRQRFEACF